MAETAGTPSSPGSRRQWSTTGPHSRLGVASLVLGIIALVPLFVCILTVVSYASGPPDYEGTGTAIAAAVLGVGSTFVLGLTVVSLVLAFKGRQKKHLNTPLAMLGAWVACADIVILFATWIAFDVV